MEITGGSRMDHRGTQIDSTDCTYISLDTTKYSDGNTIDVWCHSIKLKEELHLRLYM